MTINYTPELKKRAQRQINRPHVCVKLLLNLLNGIGECAINAQRQDLGKCIFEKAQKKVIIKGITKLNKGGYSGSVCNTGKTSPGDGGAE